MRKAFFFQCGSADFAYFGVGQTGRGTLGLDAFGQALLGFGLLGGCIQFGLRQYGNFDRLVTGRLFVSFGLLDLLDQRLFGFGLGLQYHHLAVTVGGRHFTHFLDALFFLGDGFFYHHPLADDVGNSGLFGFQRFFLFDALQLDFTFAGDNFQLAGTGHLLDFDGDCPLSVLLGHFNFALAVFLAHFHQLLGGDAGLFGF